ncbi:MAG TPA: CAP domain-containing protein [Tepidisphaeraceae bacterium]|nr:CAP domain-containing protein [Tepidisphaeraceae bacterium]
MTYRPRPVPAQMLPLESRRLLAAAIPTAYDQYLVELLNRARANPTAEAARHNIALNEHLPAGTISSAPKQPLAINPLLNDAARKHTQWMIDTDTFSHTGEGKSNPQSRMAAAGYNFPVNDTWTYAENLAMRSMSWTPDLTAVTAQLHSDLFEDFTVENRGHRINIMDGNQREIGVGVLTGGWGGMNGVVASEDFAARSNDYYLTGVAYTDATTDDDFYTPGEGLGGVAITAKRKSDNATFSTETWPSGGYSLKLAPGTYTVTGTATALGGTITTDNVLVGAQNVKMDFTPSAFVPIFATITNGVLKVEGTAGIDSISVTFSGGAYTITRNATSTTLSGSGVTGIEIYGSDGDDSITLGAGVTLGAYVDAGIGADHVQGGDGADTITGGAGKDRLFGGLGNDRINGNGSHDRLFGEPGKDRLYGGEGNDALDGGSSTDRMWGEAGNNTYFGQGGDDYFYSRNGAADNLHGGVGTDHAQIDTGTDSVATIEDLLA